MRAKPQIRRPHTSRTGCRGVAFSPLCLLPCAALVAQLFLGGLPTAAVDAAEVLQDAAALVAAPSETVPPEEPLPDSAWDHWAFKALVPPSIPALPQGGAVARTPVDALVLSRLAKGGLRFLPEAGRGVLLRRLSFDLRGLPPSPAEIIAFEQDPEPDAYERLVERFIHTPAFGEHAACRWLDLARYADTDGFEHDLVRPLAWRYRDWVIQALNRDLPHDQFVQHQLAGDQLVEQDAQAILATGFCLCGPDMPDINLQIERKHMVLNELTGTVGSVFLGLQMSCAACHDHKFDPISQHDFYRLRAVFEPANWFSDQTDGRVLTEADQAEGGSWLFVRGDFRRQGVPVTADFPRIAAGAAARSAQTPGTDSAALSNTDGPAPWQSPRLRLARWLTRPDNPLAMRVAVNRLWQQHFGLGLVPTSSDFGVLSSEPVLANLLDHLACELPRRGFSYKRVRRLLVHSAVYRQASCATDASWPEETGRLAQHHWQSGQTQDPENSLYWHAPRRRLQAEAIRDALLAASGQLSLQAGGPGVMEPLPAEVSRTLLDGQWKPDGDPAQHGRRSVYQFVRRNLRLPMLEIFDRPDTNASCPERTESTTAPQALTLWNAAAALQAAEKLAALVPALAQPPGASGGPAPECEPAQVNALFLRVFSRRATATEQAQAAAYVQSAVAEDGASPQQAWTLLCLALLNANEFLYVD